MTKWRELFVPHSNLEQATGEKEALPCAHRYSRQCSTVLRNHLTVSTSKNVRQEPDGGVGKGGALQLRAHLPWQPRLQEEGVASQEAKHADYGLLHTHSDHPPGWQRLNTNSALRQAKNTAACLCTSLTRSNCFPEIDTHRHLPFLLLSAVRSLSADNA